MAQNMRFYIKMEKKTDLEHILLKMVYNIKENGLITFKKGMVSKYGLMVGDMKDNLLMEWNKD